MAILVLGWRGRAWRWNNGRTSSGWREGTLSERKGLRLSIGMEWRAWRDAMFIWNLYFMVMTNVLKFEAIGPWFGTWEPARAIKWPSACRRFRILDREIADEPLLRCRRCWPALGELGFYILSPFEVYETQSWPEMTSRWRWVTQRTMIGQMHFLHPICRMAEIFNLGHGLSTIGYRAIFCEDMLPDWAISKFGSKWRCFYISASKSFRARVRVRNFVSWRLLILR